MVDETPDTALAEAGETLHEVQPLSDGSIGIIVIALPWRSFTEHVGEKRRVSGFLVSHELDEAACLRSKTSSREILIAETSETVVEEVQLDPFLVQAQRNGFEIEIALYHVAGERPVGAETACWGVGCGHGVHGLAFGVVIRCRGIWWARRRDGGCESCGCRRCTGSRWRATVGAMGRSAGIPIYLVFETVA